MAFTPKDLAQVKAGKDNTPEFEETVAPEEKQEETQDVPMIEYVQRFTKEDGTPGERRHGPMPVSEWAKYEKENGL